MKSCKGFLAASSLIFISCILCCSSENRKFDESGWKRKVDATSRADLYAEHEKDGVYFNPWMKMESKSFFTLLEWKLSSGKKYTEQEESFLPRSVPGALKRIKESGNRDFILWIGHNTFLLRIEGVYWLTDPMFSSRALLPKRKVPAAITPDELRSLGAPVNVIISHNHYDHLDKESVAGMPEGSRFFVPLGLKDLMKNWTSAEIIEMDWWEERNGGRGFRLICLPAQHWSRRIAQGYNRSLWAGFLLVRGKRKIFFGGDSGYFRGYREFGKKFGPVDYAFIPVTAYHPRWFMHYAHLNVPEALRAFRELGARYFVPTQWGTFRLGDNPAGYPALDLEREVKKRGLARKRFKIMNIGEMLFME